MRTKTTI